MRAGILSLAIVAVCTMLAARFMWWATARSTIWAMAAGAFLAFLTLAGAVIVAWFMTRAVFPT